MGLSLLISCSASSVIEYVGVRELSHMACRCSTLESSFAERSGGEYPVTVPSVTFMGMVAWRV